MAFEITPAIEATVGTLISLDATYAQIEAELREKILALRQEYQPKLDAVLADRTVVLQKKASASADDCKSTPALPSFWMDVLANSEEFRDDIEEYDEPVLEYLDSITGTDLDPTDENKGFRLTFKFNENPYFTNTELTKTYISGRTNEFTDQLEIIKIESDKIEWNQGKDVTVEVVTKKKSGGGAKKKASSKVEPRPSFFRYFRDLDVDNMPSELGDYEPEDDEDEDEEGRELEQLQMIMESDWERASSLKELIIPRAIRWYTGEAVMPDDEDDDEDDEDDEDDDDEDDEDDEEDDKDKKKMFPKVGANPEECKQQ